MTSLTATETMLGGYYYRGAFLVRTGYARTAFGENYVEVIDLRDNVFRAIVVAIAQRSILHGVAYGRIAKRYGIAIEPLLDFR